MSWPRGRSVGLLWQHVRMDTEVITDSSSWLPLLYLRPWTTAAAADFPDFQRPRRAGVRLDLEFFLFCFCFVFSSTPLREKVAVAWRKFWKCCREMVLLSLARCWLLLLTATPIGYYYVLSFGFAVCKMYSDFDFYSQNFKVKNKWRKWRKMTKMTKQKWQKVTQKDVIVQWSESGWMWK